MSELIETLETDPLGIASHRARDEPPLPASPRAELLRLAAAVAVVVVLGFASGFGETVVLVLALIGCIVAHEAGHFVAAKTGKVKVTEFFVGFGPRLWSVRRGETEYGVKGIPLGGYCRIVGMNNLEAVDPADESRTYRAARLGRRLLIDVAGSATHFVIALVVLFAMFFWTGDNGRYLANVPASNPIAQIVALTSGAGTAEASPAEKAGFRVGDSIVAIDGRHFAAWDAMGAYIKSHAGKKLDVTVDRKGRLLHLYPIPVIGSSVHVVGGSSTPSGGFIGIGISGVIHSGFGASISEAGGAFVQTGATTLHALGHLFSPAGFRSLGHMLTSQKAADSPTAPRPVSPVGVVRILHQAGQSGLPTVLWIVALINIFIGIFNLLPLFPLDGARVLVGLYEGLRGIWKGRAYRIDTAKLLPVMYVGLMVILLFGASALFLDLRDLVA